MATVRKKYLFISAITIFFTMFFSSCEFEIVDIRLGKYPDRIVYVANVDTEIDLSGCSYILKTKDGQIYEDAYNEKSWQFAIQSDVDFTTSGVYEVKLFRGTTEVGKFPVQVIGEEYINERKNAAEK